MNNVTKVGQLSSIFIVSKTEKSRISDVYLLKVALFDFLI